MNKSNETPTTREVSPEQTGLLPCPFCGNSVDLEKHEGGRPGDRPSVVCPKCGGQLHSGMNLDVAISRWNRRVALIPSASTKPTASREKENPVPQQSVDTDKAEECCADWKPGIEKLNGPIMLQSIRAGKDLYDGKPFRFCPWCGKARNPDAVHYKTSEETSIALAARGAAERLLNDDEYQDCSISHVSGVIETACSVCIASFTNAILHGDEVHRLWLLEAASNFINGEPLPPPRDSKSVALTSSRSNVERVGENEEDKALACRRCGEELNQFVFFDHTVDSQCWIVRPFRKSKCKEWKLGTCCQVVNYQGRESSTIEWNSKFGLSPRKKKHQRQR